MKQKWLYTKPIQTESAKVVDQEAFRFPFFLIAQLPVWNRLHHLRLTNWVQRGVIPHCKD